MRDNKNLYSEGKKNRASLWLNNHKENIINWSLWGAIGLLSILILLLIFSIFQKCSEKIEVINDLLLTIIGVSIIVMSFSMLIFDSVLNKFFLLFLALIFSIVLFLLFDECIMSNLSEEQEIGIVIERLGFAIGGIIGLLVALASFERAKASDETAKAQSKTAEEQEKGNIEERYKNAIKQLGEGKESARLGGIYGLYHLARENETYRTTICDVLCAHVRVTTTPKHYRSEYGKKPSTEIQIILDILIRKGGKLFEDMWKDLDETFLAGARLPYVYISKINLFKANLKSAYLKETNFKKAYLREADFEGADLRETDLEEANLLGVNLKGAKLKGAKLHKVILEGSELYDVNFEGVELYEVELMNLNNKQKKKINLKGAKLYKANLGGAYLKGANFEGADLTEAKLEGANLWDANLKGAVLKRAHLECANLKGTYIDNADFESAHLEGVNLFRGTKNDKARGSHSNNLILKGANLEEVYAKSSFKSFTIEPQDFISSFEKKKHLKLDKNMRQKNLIKGTVIPKSVLPKGYRNKGNYLTKEEVNDLEKSNQLPEDYVIVGKLTDKKREEIISRLEKIERSKPLKDISKKKDSAKKKKKKKKSPSKKNSQK